MYHAQRNWTAETIARFNTNRDEQRAKRGLGPFHKLTEQEKAGLRDSSNKKGIAEDEWKELTLQAWPLDRFPLKQCVASVRGVLLCPQTLDQKDKKGRPVKKIPFREGQDLFKIVYGHYSERIPVSELPPGKNYVSNDGIASKRHEYLGPQPLIAGFHILDGGETDILFWDPLLKLAWTRDGGWDVDAEFDETVESWVGVIKRMSG